MQSFLLSKIDASCFQLLFVLLWLSSIVFKEGQYMWFLLVCGSFRHLLHVQHSTATITCSFAISNASHCLSMTSLQQKTCSPWQKTGHLSEFLFLCLVSFGMVFFIYKRWPILLSCTLHRPHSSTSETCSCSVRCVSAAECCDLSHSTGSHSCPSQGLSCCRSGPACPPSPS